MKRGRLGFVFSVSLLAALVVTTLPAVATDEDLFIEAKRHYDANRLLRAIELWEKTLADPLYGPVAYILTARCHEKFGRHDRAEAVLKEFLGKFPDSPYRDVAQRTLVDAQCAQGKADAKLSLKTLIVGANGKEKTMRILQLARLERALGNYEQAYVYYRKLYLHYPASVEGLQAGEELSRLVFTGKIRPTEFSEAEKRSRASRLFRMGRFDLAEKTYRSLWKHAPSDNRLVLKVAECLYKARRNDEAVDLLKKLLKENLPEATRMDALHLLSLLYWRLDRDKEFVETRLEIANKGPVNLKRKALFDLAVHHLEKHQLDQAESYFRKLLLTGPPLSMKVSVLWKTAWIKYHKKDYEKAAMAFREAGAASSAGSLGEPSKYWQARCLMHCGRSDEAMPLLEDLARNAPLTYYGTQAAKVLRSLGKKVTIVTVSRSSVPDLRLTAEQQSHKLVANAEELMRKGFPEFALLNLEALPSNVRSSPAVTFLRAKAAHAAGDYRRAREILASRFGNLMVNPPADAPKDFVEIAFPRVHPEETIRAAKQYSVDPYLVWAVMRQESLYDAAAVSPAGALGLMQVTPGATGLVRKRDQVPPKLIANMLDPKKNLRFGIRILADNIGTFKGKLVPAIASYNADIAKVRQWVRRNGHMKQDEFIESIPYSETRLYVKNVLAGYRAYSLLHRRKDLAGYW